VAHCFQQADQLLGKCLAYATAINRKYNKQVRIFVASTKLTKTVTVVAGERTKKQLLPAPDYCWNSWPGVQHTLAVAHVKFRQTKCCWQSVPHSWSFYSKAVLASGNLVCIVVSL